MTMLPPRRTAWTASDDGFWIPRPAFCPTYRGRVVGTMPEFTWRTLTASIRVKDQPGRMEAVRVAGVAKRWDGKSPCSVCLDEPRLVPLTRRELLVPNLNRSVPMWYSSGIGKGSAHCHCETDGQFVICRCWTIACML